MILRSNQNTSYLFQVLYGKTQSTARWKENLRNQLKGMKSIDLGAAPLARGGLEASVASLRRGSGRRRRSGKAPASRRQRRHQGRGHVVGGGKTRAGAYREGREPAGLGFVFICLLFIQNRIKSKVLDSRNSP
jgi:hypothetical protein